MITRTMGFRKKKIIRDPQDQKRGHRTLTGLQEESKDWTGNSLNNEFKVICCDREGTCKLWGLGIDKSYHVWGILFFTFYDGDRKATTFMYTERKNLT